MENRQKNRRIVLKIDKFVFIAVFFKSEYYVASVFGAWCLVIQDSIVEELVEEISKG